MKQNPTPPPLTGASLDRAAHLRDDPEALARMAGDPNARMVLFSQDQTLFRLTNTGLALEWLPLDTAPSEEPPIFLGLDGTEPRFVTRVEDAEAPDDCKFIDLRSALFSGDFSGDEAAIVAGAKAISGWHASHQHCARCGAKTSPAQGGWKRECPTCNGQHFPRTDPVVIMLVVKDERVAVAHNVNFPDTLYSLIAGFVEPGETIEEAVRRETLEELGIRCGRVDYLCSQPWPFPAGLMFGCIAEALDDEFTLEEAELSEACWLDRDALAAIFRDENEKISPPRAGSIAASLLKDWLDGKVGY